MSNNFDLSKVLFLDIETVSAERDFDNLDDRMKNLWAKKSKYIQKSDEENPADIYDRAAIYAEFGKIVCISVGYLKDNILRLKSFCSHNEKDLLLQFANLLNKHYVTHEAKLCAHNGKEFDFPFIARRMVVHGIEIPEILSVSGKKPWETSFIDTMELWKFGDFKNYTSLDLLTAILDIPTPKDDINGSEVGHVYWEDDDLNRIATYCQKDVLAVVQIMLRFNRQPILNDNQIQIAN